MYFYKVVDINIKTKFKDIQHKSSNIISKTNKPTAYKYSLISCYFTNTRLRM